MIWPLLTLYGMFGPLVVAFELLGEEGMALGRLVLTMNRCESGRVDNISTLQIPGYSPSKFFLFFSNSSEIRVHVPLTCTC